MTLQLSRLHQVGGALGDREQTSTFYREVLGIHPVATFDPPGLVFFDLDGVRLLLERDASPATIYLWVDDIDVAVRTLKDRGVEFAAAPHRIFRDDAGTFGAAGEEEWMAFFEDPAGNSLVVATRRVG